MILFLIALDFVMKKATAYVRAGIPYMDQDHLTDLDFPYDVALLAEDETQLQDATERFTYLGSIICHDGDTETSPMSNARLGKLQTCSAAFSTSGHQLQSPANSNYDYTPPLLSPYTCAKRGS